MKIVEAILKGISRAWIWICESNRRANDEYKKNWEDYQW